MSDDDERRFSRLSVQSGLTMAVLNIVRVPHLMKDVQSLEDIPLLIRPKHHKLSITTTYILAQRDCANDPTLLNSDYELVVQPAIPAGSTRISTFTYFSVSWTIAWPCTRHFITLFTILSHPKPKKHHYHSTWTLSHLNPSSQ